MKVQQYRIPLFSALAVLGAMLSACSPDPDALLRFNAPPFLARVSSDQNGNPAAAEVFEAKISPNGQYIFFLTQANLVPTHTTASYQLYRTALASAATEIVSKKSDGTVGDIAGSDHFDVSTDGNQVAFKTFSTNLHPSISGNTGRQILHKNMTTGVITLVSGKPNDTMANSAQHHICSISDDGTVVTFYGTANNLVPGASGGQVYRKVISDKSISLASANSTGTADTSSSFYNALSSDGSKAVFVSNNSSWPESPQVVGVYGAYIKDFISGNLTLASKNHAGIPVSIESHYRPVYLLEDEQSVVFSTTLDVKPGFTSNGKIQVYVRNSVTGAIQVASANEAGQLADDDVSTYYVTPSGKYAVLSTQATNMLKDQTLSSLNRMYRKNLETGVVDIISADASGNPNQTHPATGTYGSMISNDGHWSVFVSQEDFLQQVNITVKQAYLKYLP